MSRAILLPASIAAAETQLHLLLAAWQLPRDVAWQSRRWGSSSTFCRLLGDALAASPLLARAAGQPILPVSTDPARPGLGVRIRSCSQLRGPGTRLLCQPDCFARPASPLAGGASLSVGRRPERPRWASSFSTPVLPSGPPGLSSLRLPASPCGPTSPSRGVEKEGMRKGHAHLSYTTGSNKFDLFSSCGGSPVHVTLPSVVFCSGGDRSRHTNRCKTHLSTRALPSIIVYCVVHVCIQN